MSGRRGLVLWALVAAMGPAGAWAQAKVPAKARAAGKAGGAGRRAERDPGAATSPLVTNNCLGCHDESMLDQQRLTAKQWTAEVKKMQGWGAPIEPENMEKLAAYLSERYGTEEPGYEYASIGAAQAKAAIEPQPDGAFPTANLKKGGKLYVAACEKCHGTDGKGTAMGVAIADRPILWHVEDFASVIRKGRGRMPRFPLGKADIGAILAHLRELHPQ
ncbi:MAG TPA: c-type cytochrome [Polyangia bacterium]|nr:c-type cytochrome [Polyangia bacterium]